MLYNLVDAQVLPIDVLEYPINKTKEELILELNNGYSKLEERWKQ